MELMERKDRDARITIVSDVSSAVSIILLCLSSCGDSWLAEKGFCILGESCPYDHGLDPLVIGGALNPYVHPPPGMGGPIGVPTLPPPPPPPPPGKWILYWLLDSARVFCECIVV